MIFFNSFQSVLPALEAMALISMLALAFDVLGRACRYAMQPSDQDPHKPGPTGPATAAEPERTPQR